MSVKGVEHTFSKLSDLCGIQQLVGIVVAHAVRNAVFLNIFASSIWTNWACCCSIEIDHLGAHVGVWAFNFSALVLHVQLIVVESTEPVCAHICCQ